MKYIIIIFSLLLSISVNAQTSSAQNVEKELLTEQEVKIAKELYIKMMQTETYKLQRQNMTRFRQKLNGVNIYPKNINPETLEEDSKMAKKKLEENIAKTKFGSFKEAIDLMEEGKALTAKMMDENKELFDLIKRASAEQIREIYELEFSSRRESLYE
jgi:hypothetical protein